MYTYTRDSMRHTPSLLIRLKRSSFRMFTTKKRTYRKKPMNSGYEIRRERTPTVSVGNCRSNVIQLLRKSIHCP
ncbi:hypothetical protein E2C01_007830 [Portunus trituberculatus]|uniref:Uncharacterized protein n=1 Tax=Portunus trituberculatus TaxID=210409 RepID=A0A5B7CZ53_PORTR|nr:hypothetical protein [Portunus trituberculatus]